MADARRSDEAVDPGDAGEPGDPAPAAIATYAAGHDDLPAVASTTGQGVGEDPLQEHDA